MTEEQDGLHERLALLVPINNLGAAQQEQVLRGAEIIDIKKKDYVFRQGDRDDWSYYVVEGEIELYADDQLINRVVGGEGASFQALAQLQPRQMSARARSKLKVLRVNRGLLDRLLSTNSSPGPTRPAIEVTDLESGESGDWLTDMLQSELFAHVPPSHIQRLLDTLESVEFKAGDVVIEQGTPGDYYYAIQSGRCEVLRVAKNGKPIKLAELEPGAIFSNLAAQR
jgi:CRP-like cAMP-binding protein